MKKIIKLIFVLCLSISLMNTTIFAEDTNYLINNSFETSIYTENNGWNYTVDNWTDLQLDCKSANDAQIKNGDYALHFYNGYTVNKYVKLTQTVSLEAGTYTFGGYFSGAGFIPYLSTSVNDDYSNIDVLSGWGTWDELTNTFTIDTQTDVTFTITLSIGDEGWGDVDAMYVKKYSGDSEPDPANIKTVTIDPIEGLSDDFMMGVDVSSVISLENAGITFKNEYGVEEDIFKILKDAGVNTIRIRLWVDPYDEDGNGYGGGNNDLETAKKIATRCVAQDLKVYLDFHYSDFWASPDKQNIPKAWENYDEDEMVDAISEYTTTSLQEVATTGADISMVQVGNETSGYLLHSKDWTTICKYLSAGCNAVRNYDSSIKIMIHFGGSSSPTKFVTYGSYLKENNVDYDVLGVSWYPMYSGHGTIEQFTTACNNYIEAYGKEIVMAENSYPSSFLDYDGQANNFSETNYIKHQDEMTWNVSVQGQASEIRDAIEAVSNLNDNKGIGYFYWEPAWITVGDTSNLTGNAWQTQYDANQAIWEQYGCGWATSYAGDYATDNPYVKTSYGGSNWENQSMFNQDGTAYDSLNVFKYVYSGNAGSDVNNITTYEEPTVTLKLIDHLSEDELWSQIWWNQINCTYEDGTTSWTNVDHYVNSECKKVIAAYQNKKAGTYTIHGVLSDDENTMISMKIVIQKETYKSIKLSSTKLVYNGKVRSPYPIVYDTNGNKLVKGTDYTVTYSSGRKNPGTYKVTIKGINDYSFSKTLTFKIVPQASYIRSLKSLKKGTMKVTYKKRNQVTGYQIRYSASKYFKTYKTKTYKGSKTLTRTISNLKSKKTYYVKVRTYKIVNNTRYYSNWSKVKTIKVK